MSHPYMPNSTPALKALMLDAIGISDVEELFDQIPRDHITTRPLSLAPGVRAEATVHRSVHELLARNVNCSDSLNFLGGGCWQHYVPAVCDEVAGRTEFLTPVWGTPSSDLGRNQAWFEFASLLGELVGMEFVGLPVYSWGAAVGHAARMAARITGRREVLLPAILDPERRAVIETYAGRPELRDAIMIKTVAYDNATGRMNFDDLRAKLSSRTAAVYVETPNHLGMIEDDIADIAGLARQDGAETIVGVDPISLGVLMAPADYGADIVVGSTQPLGVHMNGGGGAGGFIATRDHERYAREYPTLQVSIADTIEAGQRSFGMTLFHQSSYGSREEGNDWTGNSVYLWTVVNAVYMALMGPQGFVEVGETIAANSAYAAKRLAELPGVQIQWPSGFFKEFVVDFSGTGRSVRTVNHFLRSKGIFGGLDLSSSYPELGQAALYCVTEVHSRADIASLIGALEEGLQT